jgi:hypothetical protein
MSVVRGPLCHDDVLGTFQYCFAKKSDGLESILVKHDPASIHIIASLFFGKIFHII